MYVSPSLCNFFDPSFLVGLTVWYSRGNRTFWKIDNKSLRKSSSAWNDSALLSLATARHLRLLQIVTYNGNIACKRSCIQSKGPFDLPSEMCWRNLLLNHIFRQLYRGRGYFRGLISAGKLIQVCATKGLKPWPYLSIKAWKMTSYFKLKSGKLHIIQRKIKNRTVWTVTSEANQKFSCNRSCFSSSLVCSLCKDHTGYTMLKGAKIYSLFNDQKLQKYHSIPWHIPI